MQRDTLPVSALWGHHQIRMKKRQSVPSTSADFRFSASLRALWEPPLCHPEEVGAPVPLNPPSSVFFRFHNWKSSERRFQKCCAPFPTRPTNCSRYSTPLSRVPPVFAAPITGIYV